MHIFLQLDKNNILPCKSASGQCYFFVYQNQAAILIAYRKLVKLYRTLCHMIPHDFFFVFGRN